MSSSMYHAYLLFIKHQIISVRITQQYVCLLYSSNINKTNERKLMLMYNDKVIMLSHASKEHSPIVMMTNSVDLSHSVLCCQQSYVA